MLFAMLSLNLEKSYTVYNNEKCNEIKPCQKNIKKNVNMQQLFVIFSFCTYFYPTKAGELTGGLLFCESKFSIRQSNRT